MRLFCVDRKRKNESNGTGIVGRCPMSIKTVFCLGAWDLLHVGHINFIQEVRKFGDCVVIGIVKDKAIKKQKGNLRPIIPFKERETMLQLLPFVDATIDLDDFYFPEGVLKNFDIIAIGVDQTHIQNIKDIPKNKLRLIKRYPHQSTSKIIKKIQNAINLK